MFLGSDRTPYLGLAQGASPRARAGIVCCSYFTWSGASDADVPGVAASEAAEPTPLPNFFRLSVTVRRVMNFTFL